LNSQGSAQEVIRGVVANLPTPFSSDGSVDLGTLARLADFCVTSGIQGLACLLSSGSFSYLTAKERREVIRTVLQTTAGRVPVVAGVSAQTTGETIRLAAEAFDLGVSGALLLPLSYWPLRPREALEHFRGVITEVGGNWGIYNNPRTTGIDLTASMYEEICSFGKVTFTKDSSGDLLRGTDVKALMGGDFNYLCGTETQLFHSLLKGAAGACIAIASALPRECVALAEFVYSDQIKKAEGLYERLLPVLRFFQKHTVVRSVRLLSDLLGRPLGRPRPPLLALDREVREELEIIVAGSGLLTEEATDPSYGNSWRLTS
jgi:4-hydroxy-tetrahydrodipicolinate synthase